MLRESYISNFDFGLEAYSNFQCMYIENTATHGMLLGALRGDWDAAETTAQPTWCNYSDSFSYSALYLLTDSSYLGTSSVEAIIHIPKGFFLKTKCTSGIVVQEMEVACWVLPMYSK
jgi:hypothetical protein